jgi:hypothetical protein
MLSWTGTTGREAGWQTSTGPAHYFRAIHDYAYTDEPDDEYFVWPASATAMTWEREQWVMFVEWNIHYEAGAATPWLASRRLRCVPSPSLTVMRALVRISVPM